MKLFLWSALTLVFICPLALGQRSRQSVQVSEAEQKIVSAERQWADAITKGDATTLDRLFADDIVVTSGSGEIRDKAGEIKDAAASDPNFVWVRPFTVEDVRVKTYKDAAVVTGLAKWAFKYNGQEVSQERRYTHMYVKQKGQWRMVAQQMSSNLYKKS